MKRALVACLIAAAACGGDLDLGDRRDPVVLTAEIDVRRLDVPPLPDSFSGTWRLTLEGDRYLLHQEGFGTISESMSAEGEELTISAMPAPAGAFNCYGAEGRILDRVEARYEIEATDDGVSFRPVEEPCPLRRELLGRSWRRNA